MAPNNNAQTLSHAALLNLLDAAKHAHTFTFVHGAPAVGKTTLVNKALEGADVFKVVRVDAAVASSSRELFSAIVAHIHEDGEGTEQAAVVAPRSMSAAKFVRALAESSAVKKYKESNKTIIVVVDNAEAAREWGCGEGIATPGACLATLAHLSELVAAAQANGQPVVPTNNIATVFVSQLPWECFDGGALLAESPAVVHVPPLAPDQQTKAIVQALKKTRAIETAWPTSLGWDDERRDANAAALVRGAGDAAARAASGGVREVATTLAHVARRLTRSDPSESAHVTEAKIAAEASRVVAELLKDNAPPAAIAPAAEAPSTPPKSAESKRASPWDLPLDARLLLLAGYIAARTSAASDPLALPGSFTSAVGSGASAPPPPKRRRSSKASQSAAASTKRMDAAWAASVATPKPFAADRLLYLFGTLQRIVEDVGANENGDDDAGMDEEALRAIRSPTCEALALLPTLHAAGWLTGGGEALISEGGRRLRCALEPSHAQRVSRSMGLRLADLMESCV
ncbi:hypothetical protein PPROV_000918600 [Pycnococcus provasolii]|uniref:Uncharacterized protein n=1 Tax=Pycnococcus provasolii TaxID=41880 RepID=A0A830HUS1_9CHLO|nr:hypothetical protein PPROV_000918600 [Pycnococcus provasolii]